MERPDAPMVGQSCPKDPGSGPHVFRFSGFASQWHAWEHQAACIHCGITPAGGKPVDGAVAERCADLIIAEDVTVSVSAEARERMINRIMGAMSLARAGR